MLNSEKLAGTEAVAEDSGVANARTTANPTSSPTWPPLTAAGLQSDAAARPKLVVPWRDTAPFYDGYSCGHIWHNKDTA